jgi:hypothetical protein
MRRGSYGKFGYPVAAEYRSRRRTRHPLMRWFLIMILERRVSTPSPPSLIEIVQHAVVHCAGCDVRN